MKHCLFDLDGTLIDSAPSILASFAATLTAANLAPAVPLTSKLIGPPLLPTMQHLTGIEDQGRLAELAAGFKAHYDTDGYRQTVAYPLVAETLQDLVASGVRLYIVTNKRIAPTRKILDHLGWSDWFAGIYAQDAFTPSLPSKAAVIGHAIERHQIDTARAVYVGDRSEDGDAALANRMRFFWACWGYGTDIDMAAFPEGKAIAIPSQLLEYV
jgi:phosphoglycolate phosphatase